MAPRSRYTFFIDEDQRAALRAIKDSDGVPESEQIRRAIKAWLDARGVHVKTGRKAAVKTRKRP